MDHLLMNDSRPIFIEKKKKNNSKRYSEKELSQEKQVWVRNMRKFVNEIRLKVEVVQK